MKNPFYVIILSLFAHVSYGQEPVMGMGSYNSFSISPRGYLNTFAEAPEPKLTNIYLYDHWRMGNIYMGDSTQFTNLNLKIDITESALNIQYQGEVKILPFGQLLALSLPTGDGGKDIFVNGKLLFENDKTYADQLFHVLHEGEVSLYSTSYAHVVEAYSNPALALDVEDKAVKKTNYFITYNDHKINIDRKGALKKDLKEIFGEEVLSLLKGVSVKNEEDLIKLARELDHFSRSK